MKKFNFGKQNIVFNRARGYVQSVHFFMTTAVAIKLYDISPLWLVVYGVLGLIMLALVMWFDVKRNMPAEYDWTWRMNPAWQEEMQKLEIINRKIDELSRLQKKS